MFILCPWSLFFRKILVFCLHLFIVFIWTETSSCIFLYLRRDSALRKECTALQKVCVFNHFIPFHTNSMPLRWSWINKWKATEKLVDKQEKKKKKTQIWKIFILSFFFTSVLFTDFLLLFSWLIVWIWGHSRRLIESDFDWEKKYRVSLIECKKSELYHWKEKQV